MTPQTSLIRPYIVFALGLLISASLLPVTLFAKGGEVTEYTLGNGLKVIIKEDHRAPVVTTQVWYRTGSSYETLGKTGVAHALEHMMFRGTPKFPDGEYSRIVSENGGDENAFTSSDYTAYYQTLEASRLPVALELEADRMRHLTLDPNLFRNEIRVVMEERRWRTDDKPHAKTGEQFRATAWIVSTNRNPVIGWMDDLKNLTIDDLRDWYAAWYAPNNATLIIVGDVQPEQVQAQIQAQFGPLKSETLPARRVLAEPEQYGTRRLHLSLPTKLPYLLMGYKVPSLKTAQDRQEAYALEMLAYVLDASDSARLTRELVRGQEKLASASAGYSLYSRLDTQFTLSATPKDGTSLAQAEQLLLEQLQRLKDEYVPESELQRIKTQVIAEKVYALDSVSGQAHQIGALEGIGLPWQEGEAFVERIQAVTPEQLRAVARKYLTDRKLTIATMTPNQTDKPDQTDEADQQHQREGGA